MRHICWTNNATTGFVFCSENCRRHIHSKREGRVQICKPGSSPHLTSPHSTPNLQPRSLARHSCVLDYASANPNSPNRHIQSHRRVAQYSSMASRLVKGIQSPTRRVGYKTTRASPPPQQPKRHLSPVQNSTITTLVHRSDVSSLRTNPSAGVSPKGTRTLAEDHTRRSPVTLLQVTQLFP